MKTVLVAGFAMMAAMAAQASYLYWQVDTSSDSVVGQSLATALANYNAKWDPQQKQADVTISDISGARLVRVDTTATVQTPVVLDAMPMADFNPQVGHDVFIDTSYIGGNYAYYIEIVANDAQPYSLVAVSKQMTYAELVTANAVYENSELKTPSLAAWTGGSFSAAPEPTSGLLLLIGAGLLGLKRKRA